MTLRILTLCIITFYITIGFNVTSRLTKFSIMTVSIMTFSLNTLSNDIQPKVTKQ